MTAPINSTEGNEPVDTNHADTSKSDQIRWSVSSWLRLFSWAFLQAAMIKGNPATIVEQAKQMHKPTKHSTANTTHNMVETLGKCYTDKLD